ncbi:hypothetical protein Q3O60_07555 [Alkalimonas collagenimarina]|uniref:Uncharacterized protein n=1 Tax=Alkalimonas collagenimarina TaxID=400390 RepID=A0ABT9GYB9_9GAMM|nr:hypothetical protein [Alkalimonas collagenimarina]MDP4536037.1 hypothetical protein [Alkalimonas collagenimarina]
MPSLAANLPTASVYLRQLKQLLNTLYQPAQAGDSLYQSMQHFFKKEHAQWQKLPELERSWQQARQQKPEQVQRERQRYTQLSHQLEQQRLARLERCMHWCEQLLQLSEGTTINETLTRSARILGSLQLLVPEQPHRAIEVQFSYKLIYKAVLALRLLDHRLKLQQMPEAWQQLWQKRSGVSESNGDCPFREQIQLPLLMAILLQDFGQLHPDAQALLTAPTDKLDPLKALTPDERVQFLAVSQQACTDLLKQGLGFWPYQGNDKTERNAHLHSQQQRQQWIQQLLEDSQQPGAGSGNLLKVPQVYASIVMPGRRGFSYEVLPKAALLLKEGVKRQLYSAEWVDQLLRITGLFPQGYGLAFIPPRHASQPKDKYEFAIVNALYPEQPEEPHCRIVTRNLQYKNTGKDCIIAVQQNLYFRQARKQLEIVPAERLQHILSKLFADHEQRFLRQLLPRCWQPNDFFAQPAHQNLWNKR